VVPIARSDPLSGRNILAPNVTRCLHGKADATDIKNVKFPCPRHEYIEGQ